jgi:ABC-2 type transport system ATP-binding protein
MMPVLSASDLGKAYGREWALRHCTLDLPAGAVVGLVGPNGAGKTTFLELAVGLLAPSHGELRLWGELLRERPGLLADLGFVAQDAPLYPTFRVNDMLTFGRRMNPVWDDGWARERLHALHIPLDQLAGSLSGGERAQVSLTLALAKRPRLLLLDEPVAGLDPLARRSFLRVLMEAVAEHELTVVLSSHLITELERVCDYLVLVMGSEVRLAGEIEQLVAEHKVLTGPRDVNPHLPGVAEIVLAEHAARQTTLVARMLGPIHHPAWTAEDIGLEELILAHMSSPGKPDHQGWVAEIDRAKVHAWPG